MKESTRVKKWLRWKQKQSCPGKIRHEDEEAAKAHIERLVKQEGEARAALAYYRCNVCHKFHVGHVALFPPVWHKGRR